MTLKNPHSLSFCFSANRCLNATLPLRVTPTCWHETPKNLRLALFFFPCFLQWRWFSTEMFSCFNKPRGGVWSTCEEKPLTRGINEWRCVCVCHKFLSYAWEHQIHILSCLWSTLCSKRKKEQKYASSCLDMDKHNVLGFILEAWRIRIFHHLAAFYILKYLDRIFVGSHPCLPESAAEQTMKKKKSSQLKQTPLVMIFFFF